MTWSRVFLMGIVAQQPTFAISFQHSQNGIWKFPFVTRYGSSWDDIEWHSICVYGNADDRQLDQLLSKGKRLYIEGSLRKRMAMSWRHQLEAWYEIVVGWDRKGVIIPIGYKSGVNDLVQSA
ncbi:hypothetical protein GpartN1_g6928.t1 [Galdieria partita]|uniref:Single-stranded DNA-binding protein n=1 Tax=Galdieria partita TaxID=83374 RepID=A0A9C7Q3W3_9RHOD|nr:hypothetical protein GpartN1_g6098.t1 [Galdieria partita]GJQ15137.1 hypothetical protein GpartN1_g6928.t1 [Galdieria partita]